MACFLSHPWLVGLRPFGAVLKIPAERRGHLLLYPIRTRAPIPLAKRINTSVRKNQVPTSETTADKAITTHRLGGQGVSLRLASHVPGPVALASGLTSPTTG